VVDYNFTWVELLQLYHTLTCDRAFVASMWPTLTAMLDRFHRDVSGDGLLISQRGRRLFLDWAPLSRGEPSAAYNLRYLLALRAAIALAEEIDPYTQDARRSTKDDAPSSIVYRLSSKTRALPRAEEERDQLLTSVNSYAAWMVYQPSPFTAFLPTWIRLPQTRSSRSGASSPASVTWPISPPIGVRERVRDE